MSCRCIGPRTITKPSQKPLKKQKIQSEIQQVIDHLPRGLGTSQMLVQVRRHLKRLLHTNSIQASKVDEAVKPITDQLAGIQRQEQIVHGQNGSQRWEERLYMW